MNSERIVLYVEVLLKIRITLLNVFIYLFVAAVGGNKNIVSYLLTQNVRKEVKSKRGNTPADMARLNGNTEIVEMLTL